MQRAARSLPLNGVRAFEAVARSRSIKAAAAELGVTASAVSHQVKQLETALAVRLFLRRNNALDLTAGGARFFEAVQPAMAAIFRAGHAVGRSEHQVLLRASQSLATRWLVPRLGGFASAHPRIHVSIETLHQPIRLQEGVDVAISYSRSGTETADAVPLLADVCHPVAAPKLAAVHDRAGASLLAAPVISAARDDWDWRAWAAVNGVDFSRLRIAHRFDTDHVALEACIAGLGAFLSTLFMVEAELALGRLVRIGTWPEHRFGTYSVATQAAPSTAARQFVRWLMREAQDSGAGQGNRI